jgi:hypothetical protein
VGAAEIPFGEKVLGYPRALATETPEALALAALGVVGMALAPELRARWRWPAAAALAVVAFLVAGDLGDGAPTHHPARALAAVWWIGVGMGVDAASEIGARAAEAHTKRWVAGVAAAVVVAAWGLSLPGRWDAAPGEGVDERREAQIERGLDLRRREVAGAEITPCAFEHFALIAAWGAPERARVRERTGSGPAPDAACPRVEETP